MRIIQIKLLVIISILLMQPRIARGQTSLHLANDTLTSSLKQLIKGIDSDKVYKETHYLFSGEYDYFTSINSVEFAHEVNSIISKIDLPFEENQLAETTFIKCYNWTEANDKWFITLIDKADNHYIYFYETGMKKPDKYGAKKGEDYFYRLVDNLFRNVRCEDKNEDYVITGKIIGNEFISYFSSQAYHRMDIVFFNDLLKIISD